MALTPELRAKLESTEKTPEEIYEAIIAAEHGSAEHLLASMLVDVTDPEQSFRDLAKLNLENVDEGTLRQIAAWLSKSALRKKALARVIAYQNIAKARERRNKARLEIKLESLP